jgi:L-iditol 2-dehydrogenase
MTKGVMNALQIARPGAFATVEVAQPHLEARDHPGRLVVQTQWVSLCGSDIPFFTGHKRFTAITYPLPPGQSAHECVGRVVESSSERFHPGDRVLALPEGELGLAEYFVAEAAKAVPLPADVASAESSCLIQPLSTVMNAVDRLGDVAGRSVAVVGLGSIGLLFCWLLKKRCAKSIVGIDPVPERCRWAQALGIDQALALTSLEVVHAARQNLPGKAAPDICIEAVGHQMDTLNDCLELVKKRGTVLAFGVPDQPVYAVEYEIFFRKNVSLVAVVAPEWSSYLAQARDLFQSCRSELEPWVTHRYPIRQAEEAFRLYASHGAGIVKTVLDATLW